MDPGRNPTFPLVPVHRGGGLQVAGFPSRRRGPGSEVAGSRPYRRGDALRLVDWAASARLSSARGTDEFIVRDHYADDAVRVVVVLDRGSSMALFPPGLPWLSKPDAAREIGTLILRSGRAAGALIGFAEGTANDVAVELPRRSSAVTEQLEHRLRDGAPGEGRASLGQTLDALRRSVGALPAGTFVFVVSDFLDPPVDELVDLVSVGLDVVPVVVQDPVWERSFPDVGGVTVPFADACRPRGGALLLSRGDATARRTENERRLSELRGTFFRLGVDHVEVTTAAPLDVHASFQSWADVRLGRRRRYRR